MESLFSEAELILLSDLVYAYREKEDLNQREWAEAKTLGDKIDELLEGM